MAPKLTKVIRLDGLPLDQTYFTSEGYLIDRPILTSTGIFEYHNPDGSVRRELRLPEDVFDPESLKSYKGKPVIVTHDAGTIDHDNVREHQIGTILTDGYRNGNDVRAEIVIHDTDAMSESKFKELSLGYNLDLEETPGEWDGQHYDAIQRNIRINHLALVREARAGEQARLNIDGRDSGTILKGGKVMSKKNAKAPAKAHRTDGTLTKEELAKAIEEYKARRAKSAAGKNDGANEPEGGPVSAPVVTKDSGEEGGKDPVSVVESPDKQLQMVKDCRDRRDEEGDPQNLDEAKEVIAQQDEDIGILFDIIDTLLAKSDFGNKDEDDIPGEDKNDPAQKQDNDDYPASGENEDDDDEEEGILGDGTDDVEEPDNQDDDEEDLNLGKPGMNTDSVDSIVRQRVKLCLVGDKLNMDGLENMSIKNAKKAIIKAVRPGMRLDGKSAAYIDAAFDMALNEVNARTAKGTGYQKKQMFNRDSRSVKNDMSSSAAARQRMIERQMNKEEK